MTLIKRFFLYKLTFKKRDIVMFRPPTIPYSVMKHFGWTESTPMRMEYNSKGVTITEDRREK